MDILSADLVSTVFPLLARVTIGSMASGDLDDAVVNMKFYSRAPALLSSSAGLDAVQSVDELDALPGWLPVHNPPTRWADGVAAAGDFVIFEQPGGFFQIGLSGFETDSPITPASLDALAGPSGWMWDTMDDAPYHQELLSTVAVYIEGTPVSGPFAGVTNPLLFVTTYQVGSTSPVQVGAIFGVYDATSIFVDDAKPYGYLFRYNEGSLSVGTVLFQPARPSWEPVHAMHLWIAPERINLVANPSFTNDGAMWRTDATFGTATRSDGSTWGRFTPGGG